MLTYKIAYLLYDKKVKPDQILAVTFTNKAAKEMKERLVKISDEISTAQDATPPTENAEMDFDSLISSKQESTTHTTSASPRFNS